MKLCSSKGTCLCLFVSAIFWMTEGPPPVTYFTVMQDLVIFNRTSCQEQHGLLARTVLLVVVLQLQFSVKVITLSCYNAWLLYCFGLLIHLYINIARNI